MKKKNTRLKNPSNVMGCQVATCFEALFGVSVGGSGGNTMILRAF